MEASGKTRKNTSLSLPLLALALTVLVTGIPALAFEHLSFTRVSQPAYVPNQVLITLQPGQSESALSQFLSDYGARVTWRPRYSNTYVVELPGTGKPADNVVRSKNTILRKYGGMRFLDYNYIRYPLVTPNDEFYPTTVNPYMPELLDGQWQFRPAKHIYAPEGWDFEKGGDRVIVAVIDSGVRDRNKFDDTGKLSRIIHPDLRGRVLVGLDVADTGDDDTANPGPSPTENVSLAGSATHGTHVAGIIAAQADNWIGVAGLCWDNVWIWPLKVGRDKDLLITDAYIAEAIYYCIFSRFTTGIGNETPIKVGVINMSLGGFWGSDILEAACRQAAKSGIIVCAAAGNEWDMGPYAPDYPGAYEDVVCVGATEYTDVLTSFSNRGRSVDIAAPGYEILSTTWFKQYATVDTAGNTTQSSYGSSPHSTVWPVPVPWPTWPDQYGNTFSYMSGTSMASPHVAAAAALLLSHGVPWTDVKDILYQTATPKGLGRPNDAFGWGVLNMGAALRKASIDVGISSPGKGAVVATTRPRFRIDFRHARKDSIRVWIDGVDSTGDGVPDNQPTIGGPTAEITDWDQYYYTLDAAAGKTYLLFNYTVDPARAVNGMHRIYVQADSDYPFETAPPDPVSASDTGLFGVEQQTMGRGWRLFSVPYKFTESQKPEDILGRSGVLARWNYTNNSFGEYAIYSLDRSRTDDEATFTPLGSYASVTVHPVGRTVATPPAGLGYWLYLPYSDAIALPEGAGESVDEAPYSISCYYGWNMVGNPFTFPVAWSNAIVEYAGERVTAEEAVNRGWIANSFFRYDPVLYRYTYKPVAEAVMRPWEAQWVRVKVRTPDLAPSVTSPWSDEFNDGVLDMSIPEPAWFVGTTYGSVTEAGGMLRLIGSAGQASHVYVTDDAFPIYDDFVIDTKVYLANPMPTLTFGSAKAEIRFRASSGGEGYSLTFDAGASPNLISLRRTDTGAVIQGKQITADLSTGRVLYVSISCIGSQIKARVGTLPGMSDIADWDINDSTFGLPGCFRLVSDGMMDLRFDYFRYRSVSVKPADIKIIVPPNAYTGPLY